MVRIFVLIALLMGLSREAVANDLKMEALHACFYYEEAMRVANREAGKMYEAQLLSFIDMTDAMLRSMEVRTSTGHSRCFEEEKAKRGVR